MNCSSAEKTIQSTGAQERLGLAGEVRDPARTSSQCGKSLISPCCLRMLPTVLEIQWSHSVWSRWHRPNRSARPTSVTTAVCWSEVTGSVKCPTIVELPVFACQEDNAMIARPPGEGNAPTTKSLWPPKPEWIRPSRKIFRSWKPSHPGRSRRGRSVPPPARRLGSAPRASPARRRPPAVPRRVRPGSSGTPPRAAPKWGGSRARTGASVWTWWRWLGSRAPRA